MTKTLAVLVGLLVLNEARAALVDPPPVTSVNTKTGDVILNSDDLAEGFSNLFYTGARFDTAFAAKTTDALAEGTANLYWTSGRFNSELASKSTTDLAEGLNLYYTNARAQGAISATSPLTYATGILGCQVASGSQAGCLSASDWNTFNGKQTALGYTPVDAAGTVPLSANWDAGSTRMITAKQFAVKGNSTNPQIMYSVGDPSTGSGLAAPIGSLALRDGGSANIWVKTNTADTAWSSFVGASAFAVLQNKALDPKTVWFSTTNCSVPGICGENVIFGIPEFGDPLYPNGSGQSTLFFGTTNGNGGQFDFPDTGGIEDTLATSTSTQSFTNKSFNDSPLLKEIAAPATPASNYGRVYYKTDHILYSKNSAGTEVSVTGTVALSRGGTNADLSATGGTSQVLKQTSAGGAVTVARLACADLSNASASCSADATNATNITAGTLPAGRLPNPSSSTLGGVQSASAVTNQWINSISTSGVPSLSQPAFSNLSGAATDAQMPTGYPVLLFSSKLGSPATSLSSGTITAKEIIYLHIHVASYSGGGDTVSLRFNNDTGNTYRYMNATHAAGATTIANGTNTPTTTTTLIKLAPANSTQGRTIDCTIDNNTASTEKRVNCTSVTGTGGVGTQSATDLINGAWFSSTAATQITRVDILTAGGSVTMGTGTGLRVTGVNF